MNAVSGFNIIIPDYGSGEVAALKVFSIKH